MTEARDLLVYSARLAEQTERYNDMASKMKEVAGLKEGLNADERNLLSVAYKNVVGMQRSAWRIISALEEKEEQKGSVEKHNLAVTYREKIEGEVKNVCKEVIDLLNAFLIPSAETGDEKVFYHKMAGDYHRYVAEVSSGAERTTASKSSSECYQAATDAAASSLPPTHPIRLGLALNFSVFHYEILEERDNACDIAKKAFDDAIAELDTLPEESYKDSTLILQLLRDNLTLWTSDSQNEQADE